MAYSSGLKAKLRTNWKKTPITQRAAYITCFGSIIAACLTVCGTAIFALITSIISNDIEPIFISEDDPWIAQYPLIGTQLDFSIPNGAAGNLNNIPNDYDLISSKLGGIYTSTIQFSPPVHSWRVFFSDGSSVPAESKECLVNEGYPPMFQSPLNLKVNKALFDMSVFTDDRYSVTITDIEVSLRNFVRPRTDISYVKVMQPGAGGGGLPFVNVRTQRLLIDGNVNKTHKITFDDFDLDVWNGLNILIPITFAESGQYELQIKIFLIAHPSYDDRGGDIDLTSGRVIYNWYRINDPREYKVEQEDRISFGEDTQKYDTPKLVPCP